MDSDFLFSWFATDDFYRLHKLAAATSEHEQPVIVTSNFLRYNVILCYGTTVLGAGESNAYLTTSSIHTPTPFFSNAATFLILFPIMSHVKVVATIGLEPIHPRF